MSLSKKVIEEDLEPNKEKECKLERQKVIKQTKSRNRKTVTPNSGYRKEYKNYADYLKSEKWKQVKQDYYNNEQTSSCLRCTVSLKGDIKAHHHHFKYPKDWNDDTWENLIIVCEDCHDELHRQIDANNSSMPSIRSLMLEFGLYRFGQGSIFRESCIAQAFAKKVNFWLDKDGDIGGLLIDGQKINCPSLALAVRKQITKDSWEKI